MRLTVVSVLALAALLAAAPPVAAQTIVDKTAWKFAPSADHNATKLDGTPKVVGYEVDITTAVATTVIIQTINVGKPALVNGDVPYTLPSNIVKETVLLQKARAIGQNNLKSAYGPTSDPFGVSGPDVAPAAPGKPLPQP